MFPRKSCTHRSVNPLTCDSPFSRQLAQNVRASPSALPAAGQCDAECPAAGPPVCPRRCAARRFAGANAHDHGTAAVEDGGRRVSGGDGGGSAELVPGCTDISELPRDGATLGRAAAAAADGDAQQSAGRRNAAAGESLVIVV